jgi:hypothetical protein
MTMDESTTHAENQLFALAMELRRVPVQSRTRELHLRALELKRDVARWRASRPGESERERVFAEIEALTREAREHGPSLSRTELRPRRFVPPAAAVARLAR